MHASAGEVAGILGGHVVGDPATVLTGLASLGDAVAGDLSFLANPRYEPALATTKASGVLIAAASPVLTSRGIVQIVLASPDYAFAAAVLHYGPKPTPPPPGVHRSAVIGERVRLGQGVAIGPHVVIGDDTVIGEGTILHAQVYVGADAVIGAHCVLWPQVVLRERCCLGDRVILHPGAVIGADGFGYATLNGRHEKIPQVGNVIVEDDVEIGANTCIDRARLGRTRIGRGTKIDNLVQLAHNVETGAHCIIVSQVGIAGSTRLGNYVTLGGQVGVVGHISIGDQVSVTAGSGISKDVPPRMVMRGAPAQEIRISQAQDVAVRRLRQTQAEVRTLLDRVAALEARLAALAPTSGPAPASAPALTPPTP